MIYFSDAILRVFSTDPKRQASADVMETYEAELARSEIRSPDASDMDDFYKSILPSLEAYLNPGMSNTVIWNRLLLYCVQVLDKCQVYWLSIYVKKFSRVSNQTSIAGLYYIIFLIQTHYEFRVHSSDGTNAYFLY